MYNNFAYRDIIKKQMKDSSKEINKLIDEEKKKDKPDSHKIAKLEEAKIMRILFSDGFGFNERFRNPW